ncbi:thiamine-phosphate pyrophosphorylase [Thermoproteota archaeon]
MQYKGKILRIIDANLNRTKEGLRVCEEIMRMIIEDKRITSELKSIRHSITRIAINSKLADCNIENFRDSKGDVGKQIRIKREKNSVSNTFKANSQRVKEALRVLEELSLIIDKKASYKFQNQRFKFYDLEKKSLRKIRY